MGDSRADFRRLHDPSATSGHMNVAQTERPYRAIVLDAICVILLVAYFLYFALPALHGGFREDEMMNISIYWRVGALKSLLTNLTFWTTFYRPGGALYYLPLYHFFDLDPQPYRIAQISILAASIPIVYYLSRCLASSRTVAFLAVLVLCYHPRLEELVFVGSFIYDVLCGFFYFAALTYYRHIREKGLRLYPVKLLAFLALYICSLNSKEMAVTLPVIVLIYELLKRPLWPDWKAFCRWSWSVAGPSVIAGLLTAGYIYGKTRGNTSLMRYDSYRPKFSWHHFVISNAQFVGELLCAPQAITPTALLGLWAVVLIYALLRRDRMVQLMALWVVIVPLPIAFLVPIRGGGSLYLVLFGWAMIFARAVSDLITLASKCWIFIRQSAGWRAVTGGVAENVPARRLGTASPDAARVNASSRRFRVLATAFVAFILAIFTRSENQRLGWVPAVLNQGQKISHVIAALKSLNLQPAPGSTVLLRAKENPFPNRWDALFIASLVWNDRSLRIWLEGAHKLTPGQIAKMNYIISLSEFEAQIIRSPEVR